jgi:hypothetical protein
MSNISDTLIKPVCTCKVERVTGTGYTVTKYDSKDTKITDQDIKDILEDIERDYPNVNSCLIRKNIHGKKYLIVGTVWTPEKKDADDCFLQKWYENIEPHTSHWFKRFVFFLCPLLCITLLIVSNVCYKNYRYYKHLYAQGDSQRAESQNKLDFAMGFREPYNNVRKDVKDLIKDIEEMIQTLGEKKKEIEKIDTRYKEWSDKKE